MEGIVTERNGTYVKAAIIKLTRLQAAEAGPDAGDEVVENKEIENTENKEPESKEIENVESKEIEDTERKEIENVESKEAAHKENKNVGNKEAGSKEIENTGPKDAGSKEAEPVIYAETDEEGRFVIRGLDGEASYKIEIFVERTVQEEKSETAEAAGSEEKPEAAEAVGSEEKPKEKAPEPEEKTKVSKAAEPAEKTKEEAAERSEKPKEEDDERSEKAPTIDVVDSMTRGCTTYERFSGNQYQYEKDIYNLSDVKDKSYMRKTNLW